MLKNSCDCHAHVCGPESRYPYAANRLYTPHDALPSDYRRMLDSLGIERGVLVQPSIYATDNRALLDALALLALFERWVPDEKARRRILVDNPAQLYNFPPIQSAM